MAEETGAVYKPSWFSNNLNLGNILTLGGMLIAGAYGYGQLVERIDGQVGQLRTRIDNIEQFRVERVRTTDQKFADIARSLEALPNLAYRVTATEEALKGTNNRVDAALSNVSERLAELNRSVGSLGTEIAVLRQRFENDRPQRRAEVAPPER